ncbi:MAG TPA: hypothetical protein VFD82_15020 [Planctomycetota bacterium]|nr:hypothetical protein [Planctomycetota bacterium]
MRRRLISVACLMLAGCASAGRDFDETKVPNIKVGTTTRVEIEQWFGLPVNRTSLSGQPNGAVMRYTYTYARATWGGASSSGKALIVDFDQKDVVVDQAYSSQ